MSEKIYNVYGKSIQFSEMNDDWTCLCTFPHNYEPKLDADAVRSLALLGAAVVLARRGDLDGEMLPDCVPQWIRDELQRVTQDSDTLRRERGEAQGEVLDTLADMVRQDCGGGDGYYYSRMYMSGYEEALERLVAAGRMRQVDGIRYEFVTQEAPTRTHQQADF